MIIVTGATGQLGRLIVARLIEKMPPHQIGISVRDPEKAKQWAERGVRVRPGDFADPESLPRAFEGASQVLLISVNKLGPEATAQHSNAIAAAKAAGAGRILYTSHQGANPDSAFSPARNHAATERLLQASGVPFTSLRNGFYAESALFQLGQLKSTGGIVLPADGPVSWTARADLADAAVVALTAPDKLSGITPPLTNSQALDFAAVAHVASELLGRPITRKTVSDDEFRQSLLTSGLPEAMASGVTSLFEASRNGEFAVVDRTLQTLLGRAPISMRSILADYLR